MKIPNFLNQTNTQVFTSWMSLGDTVSIVSELYLFSSKISNFQFNILVVLTIMNLFVYKRLNHRHPLRSIRVKLIIGMVFASLSMCMAGTLEILRQKHCLSGSIELIGY